MDNTLKYYNQNANQFVQETFAVDFKQTQDRFLINLPAGAYILDFGCGSGRDTKYFLEKGFQVDAIDGSEELCKIARDYTGIKVKQMLFEELHDVDKYDGIWACSSILHLSKPALTGVLKKMAAALKDNGVVYTSSSMVVLKVNETVGILQILQLEILKNICMGFRNCR